MQVRSVENSAKDPIKARVVGVNQSLIGYSIRHEPHPQEEEEEEDILHLKRRNCYHAVIKCNNQEPVVEAKGEAYNSEPE